MEEPVKSMSTSQKATIVTAFRCMLGSDVNVSTNSNRNFNKKYSRKEARKDFWIIDMRTYCLLFIVLFAKNYTNQIKSNYLNSHGEEAQEKPPGL